MARLRRTPTGAGLMATLSSSRWSNKFKAGKAGSAALRKRLGSDEAVRAHYQELNRRSVESRRRRAAERKEQG